MNNSPFLFLIPAKNNESPSRGNILQYSASLTFAVEKISFIASSIESNTELEYVFISLEFVIRQLNIIL